MSTRSIFRFVDYVTRLDPAGEQVWQAMCVSGEDKDCGAKSPEVGSEEAGNDWMADHAKETGHDRFKRLYADFALVRPK